MTVVAPGSIEETCQPVLGETEMKNLTTRSPSPAQDEQQSVHEDRRELETEDTTIVSDVHEDNCKFEEEGEEIDETIVLEATNPTEETQVDKNDGKVEETAMMGTSRTEESVVTGTNNNNMIHHQGEKLKVAPVTLERFGFVNRPFAPKAAWALADNDENL
ncbi:uncharacterized protein [Ptychodera flava]|uniref:uncharacterized protein n=1 Tax=Ptychodera flava TaxID=63121 RepID=UPI00396A8927